MITFVLCEGAFFRLLLESPSRCILSTTGDAPCAVTEVATIAPRTVPQELCLTPGPPLLQVGGKVQLYQVQVYCTALYCTAL